MSGLSWPTLILIIIVGVALFAFILGGPKNGGKK